MKLEVGKAYRCENGKRVTLRVPLHSLWTPFEGVGDDGSVRGYYDDGSDMGLFRGWQIVAPWAVIAGPGPHKNANGFKVDVLCKCPHPDAPGFDWLVQASFCEVQRYNDDGKPQCNALYVDITGPWVEPQKTYRDLTPAEATEAMASRGS